MSWPLPELARVPQHEGRGQPPLHLDADQLDYWRRERRARIYRHDQAVLETERQLKTVVRARAAVAVADAVLAGDLRGAETLAELVVDWQGTWEQLCDAIEALRTRVHETPDA